MAFGEVGTSLSKIKANSLNLAGTFGFSGTVSGLADETPLVLISTFTSDGSDADAQFTSGIDSTYKEYLFVINNIHPESDFKSFMFNASVDGGSNYNVSKTTSSFRGIQNESATTAFGNRGSSTGADEDTGDMYIADGVGNDNDQSVSGLVRLYNPSSTTFVKIISTQSQHYQKDDYSMNIFNAGYCNTTSAINAVRFRFNEGEIQGGTIDMFGVV
jgi:hypothetical protein